MKNQNEGFLVEPIPAPIPVVLDDETTNLEQWVEDPALRAILDMPPSATDPNGSYTGNPVNEGETPQQDADDL